MNRVGSDEANATFAELAQRGTAKSSYSGSFGVAGTFEIKRFAWLPKAGDTFYYHNGTRGTIHRVSENVVDVSPDRNVTPIPLEHFAPHPNGDPNTWIVVGLSHT
jgi:hypothetical protein